MSTGTTIKDLLSTNKMIIAPGAYDGISAKLVRDAGYPAVYMSGACVSATYGFPDYGLLTMSEMLDSARRMADAVDIPVISDIDTGYGNELNVYRTVQAFDRAGISAVQLEDQVSPKKCGHLDGKEVIARDDYMAKVRAAADARGSGSMTIIARTDSRAVIGFDEAIDRCNEALEAGADVAFFEAPQTLEEVAQVPKLVQGPCMLNVVLSGKTPNPDLEGAEAMGYRIAILPAMLMNAMIEGADRALKELRKTGMHPEGDTSMSPAMIFERAGSGDWDPRRTRYRDN